MQAKPATKVRAKPCHVAVHAPIVAGYCVSAERLAQRIVFTKKQWRPWAAIVFLLSFIFPAVFATCGEVARQLPKGVDPHR